MKRNFFSGAQIDPYRSGLGALNGNRNRRVQCQFTAAFQFLKGGIYGQEFGQRGNRYRLGAVLFPKDFAGIHINKDTGFELILPEILIQ